MSGSLAGLQTDERTRDFPPAKTGTPLSELPRYALRTVRLGYPMGTYDRSQAAPADVPHRSTSCSPMGSHWMPELRKPIGTECGRTVRSAGTTRTPPANPLSLSPETDLDPQEGRNRMPPSQLGRLSYQPRLRAPSERRRITMLREGKQSVFTFPQTVRYPAGQHFR
jgi:hypothetical protein